MGSEYLVPWGTQIQTCLHHEKNLSHAVQEKRQNRCLCRVGSSQGQPLEIVRDFHRANRWQGYQPCLHVLRTWSSSQLIQIVKWLRGYNVPILAFIRWLGPMNKFSLPDIMMYRQKLWHFGKSQTLIQSAKLAWRFPSVNRYCKTQCKAAV